MDLSQLQVSVRPHQVLPPNLQLKIDIIVHNHLDHAVTVQTWDTPLDPRCALLGIVEVLDTTTNDILPMDRVYFTRCMPPSPESFVEIGSHKEKVNTVSLPDVAIDPTKEYRVKLQGSWKAVWDDALGRIDPGSLENLTGAAVGGFISNSAMIVPASPRGDRDYIPTN